MFTLHFMHRMVKSKINWILRKSEGCTMYNVNAYISKKKPLKDALFLIFDL